MNNPRPFSSRLYSILFWSVISAAFVGPGTVTTAATAGASYQYALIWALVFSTLACMLIQETAARIPMGSGKRLGEAIMSRYPQASRRKQIALFITGTIFLGGIAYQAGNILGAIAGFQLLFPLPTPVLSSIFTGFALLILWQEKDRVVAQILGIMVAIMGGVFLIVLTQLPVDYLAVLGGSVFPRIPSGSSWIIIGLIGTTIVPYNIFLGAGLRSSQNVGQMRWGLLIAIGLGGLISVFILLVGSQLQDTFSFPALASLMEQQLGTWAAFLLGIGLFAAGITSAITAPLAAALTAQSFFPSWKRNGRAYRSIWLLVLLVGWGMGMAQFKPVPVIILAQAFNGLLLPLMVSFLIWVANDARVLPKEYLNRPWQNIAMALVLFISVVLGISKLVKAVSQAMGWELIQGSNVWMVGTLLSAATIYPILRIAFKLRSP